jgi:hypothetical protein
MSFVTRRLKFTLNLVGENKSFELTGHRATAVISVSGGVGMGQCEIRIFGMTNDLMAKFSTIGKLPMTIPKNTVTISTGIGTSDFAQIYVGGIISAYADLNAAPNVSFVINAAVGAELAVIPMRPSSYPKKADVAIMLAAMANQAGLGFENNGVSVMLDNAYFVGDVRTQIYTACRDAGIDLIIEKNVLAIWPKGASRGGTTFVLSADTGMVSYPSYTNTGIFVTAEFSPLFNYGQLVDLKTVQIPAQGVWRILNMTHDLSEELPGGNWLTNLHLVLPTNILAVR